MTSAGRQWADELLASLPDAVFVLDASGASSSRIQGVERALGWNIDDWIGRNALEVVHPDDLEMALVSLESVGGKTVGSPIDIRLQTAEGGWRYFEIVGANLLDDPEIAGIVVVARDLTERRRFEVATNDYERFRILVHNSAAITMLLDRDGNVTSVSGAFARILGHDPEFAIGRPLLGYVVDAQQARVSAALARLDPATRESRRSKRRCTTATASAPIPLELSAVNLLDDPVVEGLVVTAYDITPLREAQDSLRVPGQPRPADRISPTARCSWSGSTRR